MNLPVVLHARSDLAIAGLNETVLVTPARMERRLDDDENVRTVPGEDAPGLPGYVTTDVTLSRSITAGLDVFVGIQNLFQQEYMVGTLSTTRGAPRLAHGGVRVRLAGPD
jgi:hypothetical protein